MGWGLRNTGVPSNSRRTWREMRGTVIDGVVWKETVGMFRDGEVW